MTRLPRALILLLSVPIILTGVGLAPRADAAQPSTWNFAQATVNDASQRAGAYGSGVIVAVVDTGVDGTRTDLGGRVLPGADCTSGTCVASAAAPDPNSCSDFWHGTHVAGTVASSDYGVAPEARILPVKVLTGSDKSAACQGSTSAIEAGIKWAVDHGAQVINLSLGGDPGIASPILGTGPADRSLADGADYAAQHGVVVAFAAGNGDPTFGSGVRQNEDYGGNALIVAASAANGGLASYSNYGGTVSITAPGGDFDSNGKLTPDTAVLSTVPLSFQDGTGYALSAGTSMATPHVAGLAALLLAQNPGITRTAVISAMESTARKLANGGAGIIDATAALAVRPNPSLVVTPTDAQASAPGPVAASFVGCPSKAHAPRGRRALISCRRSPGASVSIKLQQKTGKGWVTVFTARSSKGGTFRVYTRPVKGAQTLRLVQGTLVRTFHAYPKG